MKRSKIGWTDYSGDVFNFVLRGKVKGDCETSPGCANCYSYGLRNRNPQAAADVTTYRLDKLTALRRVNLDPDGIPLRRGPGSRPMVFVVDMGDLFHQNVPDDFIRLSLDTMASRPDVDWQILTKRAERMVDVLGDYGELAPNIWCGVTAENQAMADRRLPLLRQVRAAVRYVSVEPMLEPVRLDLDGISWVICGGESGGSRRPFDKRWAVDLWRQCQEAGVAFLFKQGSAFGQGQDDVLDGRLVKEWPQ